MDTEFKRVFSEALATLSWVNEVGEQKGQEMLETIQTVPQVLRQRIETSKQQMQLQVVQQQALLQALPDDVTQEDLDAQITTAVTMNDVAMKQRLKEQLWPLFDAQSLRSELKVLLLIARAAVAQQVRIILLVRVD